MLDRRRQTIVEEKVVSRNPSTEMRTYSKGQEQSCQANIVNGVKENTQHSCDSPPLTTAAASQHAVTTGQRVSHTMHKGDETSQSRGMEQRMYTSLCRAANVVVCLLACLLAVHLWYRVDCWTLLTRIRKRKQRLWRSMFVFGERALLKSTSAVSKAIVQSARDISEPRCPQKLLV